MKIYSLILINLNKIISGIPIFGDQSLNMARATRAEYGLTIPYPELSQDTLTTAINKILTDPK